MFRMQCRKKVTVKDNKKKITIIVVQYFLLQDLMSRIVQMEGS